MAKQRSRRMVALKTVQEWPAVRTTKCSYEAKKDRKSASAVKKAVKKVGNSRKKVRKALSR